MKQGGNQPLGENGAGTAVSPRLNLTTEEKMCIDDFLKPDSCPHICPTCKQPVKICKGQVWENDVGYKLEILDASINDLWVLHENGHRSAWEIDKFLKSYVLIK